MTSAPLTSSELLEPLGPRRRRCNIFRTLVRHPGLFRRWSPFAGKLLRGRHAGRPRPRAGHPARRLALRRPAYEWGQHVAIARQAGLDRRRDQPGAAEAGTRTAAGLVGRRRRPAAPPSTSCTPTTASATRPGPRCATRYGDEQLIEITMLAGGYAMLAGALNSLGVQLEGDQPALGEVVTGPRTRRGRAAGGQDRRRGRRRPDRGRDHRQRPGHRPALRPPRGATVLLVDRDEASVHGDPRPDRGRGRPTPRSTWPTSPTRPQCADAGGRGPRHARARSTSCTTTSGIGAGDGAPRRGRRRRLGPHPRRQPQGDVADVQARGAGHARPGRRRHRQHLVAGRHRRRHRRSPPTRCPRRGSTRSPRRWPPPTPADGIRVNAIMPGLIDTPMAVDAAARAAGRGRASSWPTARARHVPLGHQGTAWDVAHAALFLASDEAAFITGVVAARRRRPGRDGRLTRRRRTRGRRGCLPMPRAAAWAGRDARGARRARPARRARRAGRAGGPRRPAGSRRGSSARRYGSHAATNSSGQSR